jgi:hypothetical protein
LEETRNRTAWDNQLKGRVTERRKRRHGIWNRKSTAKQLISYFGYRLQALLDLASDKDAHLNRSTIIFAVGLLQFWKTKQDSHKPAKDKERNKHGKEKKREDFRRVRWFTQAPPSPD